MFIGRAEAQLQEAGLHMGVPVAVSFCPGPNRPQVQFVVLQNGRIA